MGHSNIQKSVDICRGPNLDFNPEIFATLGHVSRSVPVEKRHHFLYYHQIFEGKWCHEWTVTVSNPRFFFLLPDVVINFFEMLIPSLIRAVFFNLFELTAPFLGNETIWWHPWLQFTSIKTSIQKLAAPLELFRATAASRLRNYY